MIWGKKTYAMDIERERKVRKGECIRIKVREKERINERKIKKGKNENKE